MKNSAPPIILILLLLFSISGTAQRNKADSLKMVLASQTDDTAKVNTLNQLSRELIENGSFEAMDYAKQAKDLASTLDYKKGLAKSYNNIARISYADGDMALAISGYMEELRINEEIGDKKAILSDYVNIGNVYASQMDNKHALTYYMKAEGLIIASEDKSKLGLVYQNIGIAYSAMNDYKKAEEYCMKAKTEAINNGNKNAEAVAFNNLGVIYQYQGKNEEAMKAFNNAFSIHESLGDKMDLADDALRIGNVYSDQKNSTLALSWHQKAESMASEMGAVEIMRNVYEAISNDYRKSGKYEQALAYYMRFKVISDSIVTANVSSQINLLQAKYDTEKKESEIKKLTDENEKRQELTSPIGSKFILIGIIVLLALSFMVYILIAQQKIRNQRMTIESQQQMNSYSTQNQQGNYKQW
jgi:tetratricopeptide (TPR) repeat protein